MTGRVLVWPWHGLLKDGEITLADDSTREHPQPPANSTFERCGTFLFKNPNAPDVTEAEQGLAPAGGEFWNQALLQSGWLYGQNLEGWIWVDAEGARWRVKPVWLSTLGSMTTFSVRLDFSLFGVFGAEPQLFTRTLSVALSGMPSTAQLNILAGASRTFERRITSISATGSVAVITLGVRTSAPTVAQPSQLTPYCFLVLKLVGEGSAVSATLTRPFNYNQFWQYDRSSSEAVKYLGRHAYSEKSRVPIGDDAVLVTEAVTRIIRDTGPPSGQQPLDAPLARFPLAGAMASSAKRLVDLLAGETAAQPLYLEVVTSSSAGGAFEIGEGTDRITRRRASNDNLLEVLQAGSPATHYSAECSGTAVVKLSGAINAELYTLSLSNTWTWQEGESELSLFGEFAGMAWDITHATPDSIWLYQLNTPEPTTANYRISAASGYTRYLQLLRPHSGALLACQHASGGSYQDGKLCSPGGIHAAGTLPSAAVTAGQFYAAYNPVTGQVATSESPLTWI